MLTITETKKNIRHNNLWDYCYWLLFPCLKLMPPGSITKNQDVFIDIFLIFLFRTEYLSFFILKKIAALLFSNKKKSFPQKKQILIGTLLALTIIKPYPHRYIIIRLQFCNLSIEKWKPNSFSFFYPWKNSIHNSACREVYAWNLFWPFCPQFRYFYFIFFLFLSVGV